MKPIPTTLGKKLADQKLLLVMAGLGVVWMAVFHFIPILGLRIAFLDYRIYRPVSEAEWIGFANFQEFLADENFSQVLMNTFGISFLKIIFGFPLPILLAIVLSELKYVKMRRLFQTITYLPHFLSWAVLGGILTLWLHDRGLISRLLVNLGILSEPRHLLADPQYFWAISILSDIWKETGFSAIIFFAAIAGVDPQLYEAAEIDGANRFERIRHILFPSILPAIMIMLILRLGYSLNANFDQIFILHNQLNLPRSNVLDLYVYSTGLQRGRFAYATAIGFFRSIVALVLLLMANFTSKKTTGHTLF